VRVCLVNTFHHRKGGDCTYTFDLADLLRSRGHEIVHFAMKHPANVAARYEEFFPEQVDFGTAFRNGSPIQRARAFVRSLSSGEARCKFGRLLDETQPDIVHLQNFRRHLTFSIVLAARERGIPVVFTAHDYDPICPNSLLLARGRICTACRGKDFYKALFIRCKENSLAGSAAVAAEGMFVRLRRYYDLIDVIITPSAFARERLVEFGFDPGKVRVVHNFLDASSYAPTYGGEGALYFGRLVAEKGLDTLIKASAEAAGIRVAVAGEGPERPRLERLAHDLEVKSGARGVEFLGYVERGRLNAIVSRAMCVVMPSIWFENFPYAVLEAFALGKPVVASDIGGLPEMVEDGRTGFLVAPGDAGGLARALRDLAADPARAVEMGRDARRKVEEDFDAATHYDRIMEIYESLT
jgi:glycosyltransferase involved in cell wall biosynthesis